MNREICKAFWTGLWRVLVVVLCNWMIYLMLSSHFSAS